MNGTIGSRGNDAIAVSRSPHLDVHMRAFGEVVTRARDAVGRRLVARGRVAGEEQTMTIRCLRHAQRPALLRAIRLKHHPVLVGVLSVGLALTGAGAPPTSANAQATGRGQTAAAADTSDPGRAPGFPATLQQ